jgi:hypothetical protein
MSDTPSILVADHAESFGAFRNALTGSFPLVHAPTLDSAKRALREPVGMVVCGCHFGDGHMYDLLRHLKATPGMQEVPFVAVRCVEGELQDDKLYESVKIAVREMGGNAFVDLLRWQRRWGQAEASNRLTHLVETLAASSPPDTL